MLQKLEHTKPLWSLLWRTCEILFIFVFFSSHNGDFIVSAAKNDNLIFATSLIFTWNGSSICDSGPCPLNSWPTNGYACSNDEDSWKYGSKTFDDPVPAGNTLTAIDFVMYGRFKCGSGDDPTTVFLTTINSVELVLGRLPDAPIGCNCSHCIISSPTFQSKSPDALSYYKYQQPNTFLIAILLDDICLSSINMTFYFQKINLTIENVIPNNGSVNGGTLVNVTLSGYNTSNYCQFGDDGEVVLAHEVAPGLVNCTTPSVSSARTTTVRLSLDGEYFFDSNITFTYYDAPAPAPLTIVNLLKEYWWIFLIGALVVVGVISVFGVSIKRSNSSDPSNTPLLASGNLLAYPDDRSSSVGPGDIVLGERIGRGNFGEVFKGYWHGTVVAIKKTKLPSVATKEELLEFLEDFEREAQIMRTIRHPNVLQFLGICRLGGSEEICIITEYMPKGSLHRILHDSTVTLDWQLRLRIAADVGRGMNYLHKSNPVIIHRDLKSHNLLLDEYFKVKIADFGLAKLLNSTQDTSSMTSCGTPAWTAPEVLRNERYTEKADVFSFGIVMWELVTREEPHHGVPPFQIVFAVGTQGIRPTIPSSCPLEIATLIEECWSESAEERSDFSEIMKRIETISLSVSQDST